MTNRNTFPRSAVLTFVVTVAVAITLIRKRLPGLLAQRICRVKCLR